MMGDRLNCLKIILGLCYFLVVLAPTLDRELWVGYDLGHILGLVLLLCLLVIGANFCLWGELKENVWGLALRSSLPLSISTSCLLK